MGKIIPTANACNVSVDQLGAGYAIMTAKGIDSAEATTYMNSMFNELSKSGTKTDKVLKEIAGKSFAQLSAEGKTTGDILKLLDDYAKANNLSLSDLFGSAEAGKAALTLLSDGADGFNDVLKQMTSDSEACDKAFNQMNNTAQEQLSQSFNNLKNAMADLGTAMQPIILFVADMITKFSEWVSNMAQTNPVLLNLIVILGGLLAAIGPVLLIIGQMCIAISGLVTFFAAGGAGAGLLAGAIAFITGPIAGVIAGIVALIAMGVALYQNWDLVKAQCSAVWTFLETTISTIWQNIKVSTETIWNNVSSYLNGIWEGIKAFIDSAVNFIKDIITMAWNFISSTTSTIWNSIKGIIESVWGLIKSIIDLGVAVVRLAITTGWNVIQSVTTTIWNAIKAVIQSVWNAISPIVTAGANAVKTVVTTVFNAVKTVVDTVWNAIKTAIDTVWNSIKTIVTNGANAVKTTVKTVFDMLEDIMTAPFRAAEKVISGILGGISSAINSVTNAINNVTGKSRSIDIPQSRSISPFSLDDTDYSQVQFNYAVAKRTSISDVVATSANMLENIKSLAGNIKINDNITSNKNSNEGNGSITINNTYNSPKPASISELKKQDEIQMRRLGMQLGF